jgi:hypothetical protein
MCRGFRTGTTLVNSGLAGILTPTVPIGYAFEIGGLSVSKRLARPERLCYHATAEFWGVAKR